MMIDPERAAGKHEHDGKTYYFCATSCLERFRADPGKYLDRSPIGGTPDEGTPGGIRSRQSTVDSRQFRSRQEGKSTGLRNGERNAGLLCGLRAVDCRLSTGAAKALLP
jgi:YHS domain-containing protein